MTKCLFLSKSGSLFFSCQFFLTHLLLFHKRISLQQISLTWGTQQNQQAWLSSEKSFLYQLFLNDLYFTRTTKKIKKLWWAGFSEIYFFQCNWSENVYTATKTILWLNLHSTIYPKLDKTTSDYRIVQKAEISTPLRAIQKYNALFIFSFELKEGNDVYSEWNFWFLLKDTLKK